MMIPTGTSTINSSTNNSVGSGGIAGASGGVDDTGVTDNSNNSTLKGSGLRPLEATASASSSSHCGSAPPFSTAEYAILDRHPPHTNPAFQHQQQPDHFSPGNNNNDNNSNSNAANGSQSSVHKSGRNALEHPAQQQQQQQHSPHQHSQQYAAQSPYSSAAPTSYASPALSQQQQPHPLFHHQHQQQQPLELQPSHHTNSNSNKWTLGSTDGAYATALALQIEQQQKQELLESSDTILNGSVGGDVPTNSQQQQQTLSLLSAQKSLYQDRLIRQSSSTAVEAVLEASCEVMAFDIAELWLRTGPKTHQLIHSHLRPAALESNNPNNTNHDSDSALLFRNDLVDVYYGEKSSERTHRLSPALCKRAKEAGGVVWVTAHSATGAQALQCSISNVRTAVAVPVCHETSNTNATLIFFSIRRILVRPASLEFLVHMALAAGVASVNALAEDGHEHKSKGGVDIHAAFSESMVGGAGTSQSEHVPSKNKDIASTGGSAPDGLVAIRHPRVEKYSVTGAPLDLQWRQLGNVEYLTDGGNSWIHTAVFNGKPIVVKTLKPECQDVALAINEIESELAVHSRLNHPNIVGLIGAGTTSKGVRFFVLERLDGGTLAQMLGYDTRIRDRRRRFWKKKRFTYLDVLRIGKSIAEAMAYCHESAIPNSTVMHRDLKPDNIGFTLDGTVKILDFGLAKIIENASVDSDEVYAMSGETGSLRYMSPETASSEPYNQTADVYSFGIILWELNTMKKPFEGLSRDQFYERVVYGGERPPVSRKWPVELSTIMTECWDADMHNRPKFRDIAVRLQALLEKEQGVTDTSPKKSFLPKLSGMMDRHSTWF